MKAHKFCGRLFFLVIASGLLSLVCAEDTASVDLTGPYTAIVTVRNWDGSFASGVRYRLTYATPSKREVLLDEGTPQERKFQFEQVRLLATIAAGTVPPDGRIQLHRLSGSPRTFSLQVGDDGSRPGDFFEGSAFLHLSFTNRTMKTNLFTVELPKTVAMGERAPDFSVEDVFTHKQLRLSDFKGKLVVLKFWATDCPPCQPDMQENNELIGRKKTEWKGRVAFVGVSLDEDGERLRKHVQKQGWNEFQHVWAKDTDTAFNSGIARSYGVRGIPACYLIHPTGLVVWRGNRGNIERLISHFLTEVNGEQAVQDWLQKIRKETESR